MTDCFRYHQLVLHDPVWYDHLPYLPFPKHWPVFTPKDKLAEWFESYAKLLELNCWTETMISKATWDGDQRKWTVELERKLPDGTIQHRTLYPRHIVQATGHSGEMQMPSIKGIDGFKGDVLCHSSRNDISSDDQGFGADGLQSSKGLRKSPAERRLSLWVVAILDMTVSASSQSCV